MRIHITIDTDNAAFEDDEHELLRIIQTIPAKIEEQKARGEDCLCDAPEAGDKLLDINGNTVGKVRIEV